jgi:hypothetical protein
MPTVELCKSKHIHRDYCTRGKINKSNTNTIEGRKKRRNRRSRRK